MVEINSNNNKSVNSEVNTNNNSNTKNVTSSNSNTQTETQSNINNKNLNNTTQIQNNESINKKNNNSEINSMNNKSGSIEWILGENENSVPSTIVIKNNTGEKIPQQKLIEYIKEWILNAQVNYSQGSAATMWVPEFFNAVPDNILVEAFINANGESALSKSITGEELGNTNAEIANLISKNKPLLTQSEIFKYIYKSILPKNEILKIENSKYDYEIYESVNDKVEADNTISKYTGMTSAS